MVRFSAFVGLLSLSSACCLTAAAQISTGRLSGHITDKATKEGVYGAMVIVSGTAKAAPADADGLFNLDLAPGTYTIKVASVGFKGAEFPGIVIREGQTTTLNAALADNNTQLAGVTVVGQKQTGTEMSLINDLRKSEVVVSGVSAEQIVKTQDRDAAEVVKRIPGVTIQDSRFILIRGLSERYNTVMLNDALAPSSEADTRAFSFDILPASVIDRILVFKSAAPELPGEFGGGVVKVYTRNSALQNATLASVSTSYRTGTTLGDFTTSTRSSTDFLGFDGGTRKLPDAFPTNLTNVGVTQRADLGRQLPNDWSPRTRTATPDLRLSLGVTRVWDWKSAQISTVTAVSYSDTHEQVGIERFRYDNYDAQAGRSGIQYRFQDQRGTQNTRLGVVHNWAVRLDNRNKLEFRNLFNQLGMNQITTREGQNLGDGTDLRAAGLRYDARSVYSGQLQGTHDLADDRTTLNWTTGYSFSNRNQPDLRRYSSQRITGSGDPFRVVIPGTASASEASRFYSDLTEHTVMASGQWERRFGADSLPAETRPKLRAGFYAERKMRDFSARWTSFTIANRATFDYALLELPILQIFAPQNVDAVTGFALEEGTSPSDAYTASNTLGAGYVSGVLPLGTRLNLTGGVRVEAFQQRLNSARYGGVKVNVDTLVVSILPSFNATYTFSKRKLLRLAGGVTVNRAEFRELAPFSFYDFEQNYQIDGNPRLKPARIYNADLRYEFYPTAGELVSLGVFGKVFENPIEKTVRPSSGDPIFLYQNATRAVTGGVELEARQTLAPLTANPVLSRFGLTLNASLIASKVTLTEAQARVQESKRQMQGQSPYILNTGIFYQDDERGLSASVLYNVVGKRIFAVGVLSQEPTIYEMPRNVLDFQVTKRVGTHFEVKAGIQDIFNQRIRFVQDSNSDGKITGLDENIFSYRRGQYSTVTLLYRF